MRLEHTIQALFDECPMLFNNRLEVLDHLFCVIGNGFKWKNGQLVYSNGKMSKLRQKDVKLHGGDKACQIIDSPEYHKFKSRMKDDEWYGLCTSSYLFDYPSDIKSDWLAGIEETKKYLELDGISTNINDYK